jgi:hypothetical protein
MEGIALELDNPSLSVLGQNPTTSRTLSASRGIPGGLASYHVFWGLYQGIEGLGGLRSAT